MNMLLFLSNSSADNETVMRFILPNLEIKLQELLGTRREIVCFGDKHFRAGRPIYDETVQQSQSSSYLTSFAQAIFVVTSFFLPMK